MKKGKIPVEKRSFLNHLGLFLSARETFLIISKVKIPTPDPILYILYWINGGGRGGGSNKQGEGGRNLCKIK